MHSKIITSGTKYSFLVVKLLNLKGYMPKLLVNDQETAVKVIFIAEYYAEFFLPSKPIETNWLRMA